MYQVGQKVIVHIKGKAVKDFAKRLMDEKYGAGNYKTGPSSEYNKIKSGVIAVLNKIIQKNFIL